MSQPEWKIQQPAVEDMMFPVRCTHCGDVYSLTQVHVTARYTDCSVWTSPCCGVRGIDDRPWVRDRHYREISKDEAASGGDFYDVPAMIQAHEGIFRIQSPDGFRSDIERGRGEIVRMSCGAVSD